MSTIDKQRITAVRKLEQLGYTFAGDDWIHPRQRSLTHSADYHRRAARHAGEARG